MAKKIKGDGWQTATPWRNGFNLVRVPTFNIQCDETISGLPLRPNYFLKLLLCFLCNSSAPNILQCVFFCLFTRILRNSWISGFWFFYINCAYFVDQIYISWKGMRNWNNKQQNLLFSDIWILTYFDRTQICDLVHEWIHLLISNFDEIIHRIDCFIQWNNVARKVQHSNMLRCKMRKYSYYVLALAYSLEKKNKQKFSMNLECDGKAIQQTVCAMNWVMCLYVRATAESLC